MCAVVVGACYSFVVVFFFSSRRRHTRCALVTGVQTCALPISPANPNILPEWATYKPEKAWSYEAGLKFNLLDRRLTGSIAAYYVDWTNQQVSNTLFVASVSRTVTAIANAEKSRVQGKIGRASCRERVWQNV